MENQTLNIRLTALKAGRILKEMLNDIAPTYPIVVEKDNPAPFITYRRTATSTTDTKDYSFRKTLSYDINVVAKSYDESVSKCQDCWEILDGFRGYVAGLDVDEIRVINSSEGYNFNTDEYIQTMTVQVKILTR